MEKLGDFVRLRRKKAKLTQADLASRAGVGLRFIRELETHKKTLRLDKVEQVLQLFGHRVGAVKINRESEGNGGSSGASAR